MDKPVFEKGIPLPVKGASRCKYYWLAEMEVGDSFTCSAPVMRAVTQLSHSRRSNGGAHWLPNDFKVSTQKIGKGLYRVWRVA